MAKSLRKVRAKLAARYNSHTLTIKSLTSSVNPMAYKTPGSMKRKS